jgi:tetratricopeptide (TPR) repeat protein
MKPWALGVVAVVAVAAGGCQKKETVEEWTRAAEAFFAAKRFNDAYLFYKRVAERQPENVAVLIRLAECCLWLQDAHRGLRWIDRALALAPTSVAAWERKGELLLAARRYREAVACFRRVLALDGWMNVARVNMALAYLRLGDTWRAVQIAEEAVAVEPQGAAAHLQYAQALEAAGREEEAAVEYRRALALSPDEVRGLVDLARLLVRLRRSLAEARQLAQRAARLDPSNAEAAALAAWALYLSGDQQAGMAELEQVARTHPASGLVWTLLARGWRELGDAQRARQAAQIARQIAVASGP